MRGRGVGSHMCGAAPCQRSGHGTEKEGTPSTAHHEWTGESGGESGSSASEPCAGLTGSVHRVCTGPTAAAAVTGGAEMLDAEVEARSGMSKGSSVMATSGPIVRPAGTSAETGVTDWRAALGDGIGEG